MIRRKDRLNISEEISDIISNTHQMVNGDLDIKITTDKLTSLGDLANDINQISVTFNGYINEISHILSHLSVGNMAVSFTKDIEYRGDFLPIKNALHKIRRSLNSSFEEINLLSNEVDRLCGQVEEGSEQIAKNASEQSELINDLTNTIYRITDQTANNAANAKLAAKSVNQIQDEAQIGSGYMEQMLVSIEKVQASSNDISNIVTIISELAEQTKLLALNAAIEAARAGDSGKGFSVVASEVGILAERSSDAVRQTSKLISHSMQTAHESVTMAKKTAGSFRSIHDSIEEVTKLCNDIAEGSEIQAKNLKDTSNIITDISGAVQNNAAYAQENCAEAVELTKLSADLKSVMTRFRLKNQVNQAETRIVINEISIDLLKVLFTGLREVLGVSETDQILIETLKQYKNFECCYVIDSKGFQYSHTIMNPDILIEQNEDFKPAIPGDYHGTKRYFCQAVKNPNEWCTSFEYISTATGGLCKTLSCSYEGKDGHTYVICADLICRY